METAAMLDELQRKANQGQRYKESTFKDKGTEKSGSCILQKMPGTGISDL